MCIITKDAMSYKTYCKNKETLSIKLRIIVHRIRDQDRICDIAERYSMHRNSVANIMDDYEALAPPLFREKVIAGSHFSLEELKTLGSFLLPRSRRPHSHRKQASVDEEAKVSAAFEHLKVGAKKLVMMLTRKKEIGDLSLSKVR